MKIKLKQAILLSLLACDGKPQPQEALLAAVQIHVRPKQPTLADIEDALKDVEADKYVSGFTDDLTGTSWTLTTSGTHKARQLR